MATMAITTTASHTAYIAAHQGSERIELLDEFVDRFGAVTVVAHSRIRRRERRVRHRLIALHRGIVGIEDIDRRHDVPCATPT
jgi:hypothetical protein